MADDRPFLNPDKSKWILTDDIQIPVIENILGKDIKHIKEIGKEAAALEESGEAFSKPLLVTELDEKWYNEVAKVGLNKSWDELLEILPEPDVRQLLAEVWYFLTKLGTIKRAKQFALYQVQTLKKEQGQSGSTQNLETDTSE